MRHSFTKTIAVFAFAFLLVNLSASAQPITGDEIKTQFVKDWERAKAYTIEYLNTMPADKYSFKAVDSIRSFAQQMLHLAAGNVGLIQFASGAKLDFPNGQAIEASPTAQTKDSVVYYVTKSYDFAIQTVKDFDPAKFGEMVGPANRKATRFAVFLKAFEHQTHHRGQTTIYIRLLGIRPPGERLF
jgi:uncharacterized damage-inducible protein DinB